jgi:hypothetical protein
MSFLLSINYTKQHLQPPEGVNIDNKSGRVLIRNDNTGKETFYRPDVITEVLD